MHFGGCGPPWDARVASDRPPLLIGACCEVRVWDVCVSKSLDVGHLTPMHPHELWPGWAIVWGP